MAAEGSATKGVETGIVDHRVRRAFFQLQRCQGHERLVGRTRWVRPTQSTVEQRFVDGLIECLPVFLVNAFDKQEVLQVERNRESD